MNIQTNNNQMIINERNLNSLTGSILSTLVGLAMILYFFFAKSIPIKGLEQHPGGLIIVFGLFMIGVGLSFLLKTQRSQTVLSKAGPSSFKKLRFLGGTIDAQEFNLSDITKVDHHVTSRSRMTGRNGMPKIQITSVVSLILKNGDIIEAGQKTSSPAAATIRLGEFSKTTMNTKGPLEKQAIQIADFIGVKVKQNEVPNEDPRIVIDSIIDVAKTEK